MSLTDLELHELIRALSPAERGYWVKYTNGLPGKDGERYLQLFKALQQMPEFDEERLEQELRKIRFPAHRYRIRNYLYHSIVDALQRFTGSHTVSEVIMAQLLKAYTLQRKKMLAASDAMAVRCERTALTNGLFGLATEAVRVQHGNHLLMYQEEGTDKERELQLRMNHYSDMQNRLLRITRTGNVMLQRFRQQGAAQDEAEWESFAALFAENIEGIALQDSMDVWTRYYMLDAMAIRHLCLGEPGQVGHYLHLAYRMIWDNLGDFDDKMPLSGISYALLDTWLRMGRHQDVRTELDRLGQWLQDNQKKLPKRFTDHFDTNLALITMHLEVSSMETSDEQAFTALVQRVGGNDSLSLLQQVNLHLLLACGHLYAGRFDEAKQHVMAVLNERALRNYDVSRYWEMELMLLFVELGRGNEEQTEYQHTRLRRKLTDRKVVPYRRLTSLILEDVGLLFRRDWKKLDTTWRELASTRIRAHISAHNSEAFWLTFDPVRTLAVMG